MTHYIIDEATMEIEESGTKEEMIEALNTYYQEGWNVVDSDEWESEAHDHFDTIWEYDMGLWDKISYINVYLGYDLQVYDNDEEFFDLLFSDRPYEAVTSALYGDYRAHDDYVTFDGYGNLVSLDRADLESMVDDYNGDFIDYRKDELRA